jgi:hypothetical protein
VVSLIGSLVASGAFHIRGKRTIHLCPPLFGSLSSPKHGMLLCSQKLERVCNVLLSSVVTYLSSLPVSQVKDFLK